MAPLGKLLFGLVCIMVAVPVTHCTESPGHRRNLQTAMPAAGIDMFNFSNLFSNLPTGADALNPLTQFLSFLVQPLSVSSNPAPFRGGDASGKKIECNMEGVDPTCFLTELGRRVGDSWGTADIDAEKAGEIANRLDSLGILRSTTYFLCEHANVIVPSFTRQQGIPLLEVQAVINQVTAVCN